MTTAAPIHERQQCPVHGKARQSAGPLPVWLRIDALDGFFQFTEWVELDWTERINRVATALRRDLATKDR